METIPNNIKGQSYMFSLDKALESMTIQKNTTGTNLLNKVQYELTDKIAKMDQEIRQQLINQILIDDDQCNFELSASSENQQKMNTQNQIFDDNSKSQSKNKNRQQNIKDQRKQLKNQIISLKEKSIDSKQRSQENNTRENNNQEGFKLNTLNQIQSQKLNKLKKKKLPFVQTEQKAVKRVRHLNEKSLQIIKKIFQTTQKYQITQKQIKPVLIKISNKIGIGLKNLRNLYKQYCFDQTLSNSFHKVQQRSKQKQGTQFKLTKQRIKFIKKIIEQNTILSTKEIYNQLNKQNDLKKGNQKQISMRCVRRLIQMADPQQKGIAKGLGSRNNKAYVQGRFKYANKYFQYAQKGYQMHYISQLQFNLPNNKNSPCLIISLTQNGISGIQMRQQTFKRAHYLQFLQGIYKNLNNYPQNQKFVLLIDNQRIQDYTFQELANKFCKRIEILRLPLHIPAFNAANNLLNYIKRQVFQKGQIKDINVLGLKIQQQFKKIGKQQRYQIKECFCRIPALLQKALKKEHF